MNTAFFAVVFPVAAAIPAWLFFHKKTSDKEQRLLSHLMILIGAAEFLAVSYMVLCDMGGTDIAPIDIAGVGGLGLHFGYSGFRGILGVLTAASWLAVFLFSREYMEKDTNILRYDLFNLITLGATMGIFYADDLFTLFFFFEVMSFASFMWVAHRQTQEALYAAGTYLGIAAAGGLSVLMGLFIVYGRLGTLSFDLMYENALVMMQEGSATDVTWLYVAAGCMFVGFGAKAGAFPVHVWLPQSYTQAPSPATALLSAILSKTGIFGIWIVTVEVLPMQGSWGMFIVMTGVATMVLGGLRGLMSGNFKTTLAYSSMSQIGFILVGVGMQGLLAEGAASGSELAHGAAVMAVNGTFLHMINHSLAKIVLFMIAGILFLQVGSCELDKVRGLGRKKPFLLVTFLLAAAGVGGIPLLNGYVSKTLLHESIIGYTELLRQMPDGMAPFSPSLLKAIEYLFLFSGGLTIAYMTKLFVVLFVDKNESGVQAAHGTGAPYASVWTKAAIAMCALPIPFIGLFPHAVADHIASYGFVQVGQEDAAMQETIHYFSVANLSGALVSVASGAVLYLVVIRLWMLHREKESGRMGYRELFPSWIDLERYVYRAVFYRAFPFVLGIISRILDSIVDILVVFLRKTVYSDRALPYELPEGNRLSHRIGYSLERLRLLRCRLQKKEYQPRYYEHRIALRSTDLFENFRIIERSLSFGLFMFCVGLGLTMVYLLMVN